jgi:hypothetical protein
MNWGRPPLFASKQRLGPVLCADGLNLPLSPPAMCPGRKKPELHGTRGELRNVPGQHLLDRASSRNCRKLTLWLSFHWGRSR